MSINIILLNVTELKLHKIDFRTRVLIYLLYYRILAIEAHLSEIGVAIMLDYRF